MPGNEPFHQTLVSDVVHAPRRLAEGSQSSAPDDGQVPRCRRLDKTLFEGAQEFLHGRWIDE